MGVVIDGVLSCFIFELMSAGVPISTIGLASGC